MQPISLSTACLVFLLLARAVVGVAIGLDPRLVDLGYARYRGLYDAKRGLDIWRGIRYAAPPVGPLRWQMPQPPLDESAVGIIDATDLPPLCPQAGAFATPVEYGFNGGPGANGLPVLVWIHGGGYSLFGARYDPSGWIAAGGYRFVAVEIQYRLGAFGFLASREVRAKGQLNAGLLDQRRALQWVQQYIAHFGGDPSRVTVAGESSGAGSTLHQALAYGGRDEGLFSNIYMSSPCLPPIYAYNDEYPTEHFRKFAELAGCASRATAQSCGDLVFECLVAADTSVLQNASEAVAATQGYFGSFAWLPVVDGRFVRSRPTSQLLEGRVAGKRILVGTNANEGVPLTNPRVNNKQQYDDFIRSQYPNLNAADHAHIEGLYRVDDALEYGSRMIFDTTGNSAPSALLQSGMATGIQQTVFNMAAETTFACPAQWLSEALSRHNRSVWRYQYSLTASYHGADLAAIFNLGLGFTSIAPGFRHALQNMLSAFITNDCPTIPADIATGYKENASVPLHMSMAVSEEVTA
ncbi:Alpha/Beta hydrolase protein [Microdochium trichocladiopsis]|uniref:Carboxylic ester hydrolase n=1 Tax=Microdochium trichocladiopsis TaxID=1682393 RepID=A0A9P8Y6M9_9PEZI|nr:Alpha/Beta hydrolase protein [Microdochium trichocladiopsis]KAH7029353.1 Alpha/Beta hydrolase protein [Microdochium trichocladiopsis]